MTPEEFKKIALSDIEEFISDWKDKIKHGDTNYPSELELPDWFDQLNSFIELKDH